MYTLQSGQIDNALRGGGFNDTSASQMVQQLANCQQVLEHRSNVELTKPTINYFPTVGPTSNTFSFPTTNVNKNITINVPPWKTVEWKPIEFVPSPPWENPVYPEWPEWGWNQLFPPGFAPGSPGVGSAGPVGADGSPGAPGSRGPVGPGSGPGFSAPGGAALGPTIAQTINAGDTNVTNMSASQNVNVDGDISIQGDTRVTNDVFVGGDLTTQNNAVFNGPSIFNNQVTFNSTVVMGGVALQPFTANVVTAVFWEGNALKATVTQMKLFGLAQAASTSTVISGSECP